MLIASVKIRECGREGEHLTIQLLWTTAQLIVTRVSIIYLRSGCVFLATGVNQDNLYPPTLKASLQEKINKIMLPFSTSQVSHPTFSISKLIGKQVFHPNGS